ncbi:hypothetical protein PV327_007084 [Microctonus hyperodae]|uniref:Uncharacterized protein n=1 Tax=Microctonus hyperodae TaxID=165561 RepID=A0AA39F5T0_MICHY|nr:hypothetical protein PV327_007084 [Microctonus hyperodae]
MSIIILHINVKILCECIFYYRKPNQKENYTIHVQIIKQKHSGYYPEGKDLFAAKAAVTGHCPDIVETTTASSSPLTLGVIGRYVGVTGRGYRRGVQKLLKTQDTDQQRV